MPIARPLLTCAAAIVLLAAAPAHPPSGTPVLLQAQPGTPLDQAARALMAQELAAARAAGEKPLLLLGTARLGGERPALFVQLQSPRQCGSAGCTTSVYAWEHGGWKRVLDGTSGQLTVASSHSHGMADLLANDEHYVWTGTEYRDTRPAPAVDLRPHTARHRPAHSR